jgi:predicted DNA-binding transcriptional regulator YafY
VLWPRIVVVGRRRGVLCRGRLEDDWVEVTAETRDVFWASKTLLKYGENCVVLEPAELVAEMKKVVKGMARNYGL